MQFVRSMLWSCHRPLAHTALALPTQFDEVYGFEVLGGRFVVRPSFKMPAVRFALPIACAAVHNASLSACAAFHRMSFVIHSWGRCVLHVVNEQRWCALRVVHD